MFGIAFFAKDTERQCFDDKFSVTGDGVCSGDGKSMVKTFGGDTGKGPQLYLDPNDCGCRLCLCDLFQLIDNSLADG